MSSSLSMSLEDSIKQRKQSGGGEGKRFSKGGAGKFGKKKIFKKRFDRERGDRGDRPFFKRDRPFRRERSPFKGSRGSGRRFGSDRPPRFANKFIRRTGPRGALEKSEDNGAPRFRENRETEGTGRGGEGSKIKISNLDFNITHKDIMELFSKLGTVKKNKIIYDELGRSRGKAFVEFEKPENAADAIKEYNGAVLDGKTITVEYDDERPGRRGGLLRKPISRDNFKRRDDFKRDDFKRDDFRRDDFRRDDFRREDRFRDRGEGDWRREKGDRNDFERRPFRRGGFRGGFRKRY